jgi:hypothetical protein
VKRLTALIGAAICTFAFQPNDAQAAAEQYAGVFELTVTVGIPTAVPSNETIYCVFSISDHGDASGGNKGYGVGTATMAAGGTRGVCTVQIPYDWLLSNPKSNVVTPSYAVGIGPKDGSKAALVLASLQYGLHGLPEITGVPPSGTHTALTATTQL